MLKIEPGGYTFTSSMSPPAKPDQPAIIQIKQESLDNNLRPDEHT
jgi:hypothetical protein